MADQEVAKHVKKLLASVNAPEHRGWHKARELLLECFIIVFAVSLSIWFHSLGEHRHEQQQVKAFLLGLKGDIQNDIKQSRGVVSSHREFDLTYRYLTELDPVGRPEGKFDAAYAHVGNNAFLVPQDSRYEGFKSSGKLTNIENEALLENIVTLYQFDIPKVQMSSGGWRASHTKLLDYIETSMDGADTREARYKILTSPKGKRMTARMQTISQLYERFAQIERRSNEIIMQIDQAYPKG